MEFYTALMFLYVISLTLKYKYFCKVWIAFYFLLFNNNNYVQINMRNRNGELDPCLDPDRP